MMEGTIIRGRGGLYTVLDGQGNEYVLRANPPFNTQFRVHSVFL